MNKTLALFSNGIIVLAVVTGCGKSIRNASAEKSPTDVVAQVTNPNATYSWLKQNVFEPSCTHCHSGAKPAADYDITSYDSIMASDTMAAGKPDESDLYNLVAAGKMPRRAARLSDDKIQALHDWIQAGAPNN